MGDGDGETVVTILSCSGEVAELRLGQKERVAGAKEQLRERLGAPAAAQQLLHKCEVLDNHCILATLPQPLSLTLVLGPFNRPDALMSVVRQGHAAAARALLAAAASDEERNGMLAPEDRWGRMPLHWAAESGHGEVCRALVEAAWDTEEGRLRMLASAAKQLHSSALSGHASTCQTLLDSVVRAEDRRRLLVATAKFGWTALHFAARSGHEMVCRVILAAAPTPQLVGQLLLARTQEGLTSLHAVTAEGPGLVCRVAAKAEETALHLAAKRGHASLCRLLLELAPGDAERSRLLAATGRDGQTALHCAAQFGRGDKSICEILLAAAQTAEERRGMLEARTRKQRAADLAPPGPCRSFLEESVYLAPAGPCRSFLEESAREPGGLGLACFGGEGSPGHRHGKEDVEEEDEVESGEADVTGTEAMAATLMHSASVVPEVRG